MSSNEVSILEVLEQKNDITFDERDTDSEEIVDEIIGELQDMYHLFILNPPHDRGYTYAMYRNYDEVDVPISRVGGLSEATFWSMDNSEGEDERIEFSPDFFKGIGMGYHHLMSSGMSLTRIYSDDDVWESVYDMLDEMYPKISHQEKVMADSVCRYMHRCTGSNDTIIMELAPVNEFVGLYTEFKRPDNPF